MVATRERPKQYVVLRADGTEYILDPSKLPDFDTMRGIVGGHIEIVKVLRADLDGFVYTYMVTNEDGLRLGLPRNEKATGLYQANTRRAYPDADNPFAEADRAFKARFPKGTEIMELPTPDGYASDPWIAGDVLWFDGWTIAELQAEGF